MMDYEQFTASLADADPPPGISEELLSLWYDGRNDWERSHIIAQDIQGNTGSLIHAYLHRKEGDIDNARYWYHRAGKNQPAISHGEEWKLLVRSLL
jgi:hypothetical protein